MSLTLFQASGKNEMIDPNLMMFFAVEVFGLPLMWFAAGVGSFFIALILFVNLVDLIKQVME